MSLSCKLEVDIGAFRRNVKTVQSILGKENFFYPVIKSNAYGLGIQQITKALQFEKIFEVAVLNVEEAHSLRSFKNLKLLILGPITFEDAKQISKYPNWIPVIGSHHDLKLFSEVVFRPHPVHIKIDVGMSRLGFSPEKALAFISFFKKENNLKLEGLCSHFPGGGEMEAEGDETIKQIEKFKNLYHQFSSHFPGLKAHLFNTVSLISCLTYDRALEFGARLGKLLYGVKPPVLFKNAQFQKKWLDIPIEPVSTLKSYITAVRKIDKGQGLSYEWSWKAQKFSQIAVISMGYADGFWRHLSNRACVLFRGVKVSVVGNVCMNFFMVDVTGFTEPQIGEEVVIYGKQGNQCLSISDVAENAGTVDCEIMTSMGITSERVYKNEQGYV